MAKGAERVKLTSKLVEALEPREVDGTPKGFYVWDSEQPGFAVRVLPSGSKAYWCRYRTEKEDQKWVKVGEHPTNTAEEARKKAKKELGAVSKGDDPAQERELRKAALNMKELADRFIQDHASPRLSPVTIKEYRRQLDKIILPVIGELPVRSVSYEHIAKIHKDLSDRPVLSNRVHALLHKLFNQAEKWGLRPVHSNPCFAHEKFSEDSRERFLTDAELEALGTVLEEAEIEGVEPITAILAIKLMLFSGMRLSEALELEWSRVDLSARLLRIPDSKTGFRSVDVNDYMNDVLVQAKTLMRLPCPFVFPSRVGDGHFVGLRRVWVRLLKKASTHEGAENILDVHPHDMRRTFGTIGASDVDLPHETIGKVLGHKTTQVTAIYARLAGKKRKQANTDIGEAMAKKLRKTRGA